MTIGTYDTAHETETLHLPFSPSRAASCPPPACRGRSSIRTPCVPPGRRLGRSLPWARERGRVIEQKVRDKDKIIWEKKKKIYIPCYTNHHVQHGLRRHEFSGRGRKTRYLDTTRQSRRKAWYAIHYCCITLCTHYPCMQKKSKLKKELCTYKNAADPIIQRVVQLLRQRVLKHNSIQTLHMTALHMDKKKKNTHTRYTLLFHMKKTYIRKAHSHTHTHTLHIFLK